jgi:hypothetical protein
MYIWGLQIGLNFVPAMKTEPAMTGAVIFVGTRLSFFVVQCDERLVL